MHLLVYSFLEAEVIAYSFAVVADLGVALGSCISSYIRFSKPRSLRTASQSWPILAWHWGHASPRIFVSRSRGHCVQLRSRGRSWRGIGVMHLLVYSFLEAEVIAYSFAVVADLGV